MQGRNTDRKTKHLHNRRELHSAVLVNSAAECSESRGDTSWERTGTESARHRDLARLAHIAADSCSRQRDCSGRRSRTAIPSSCKARYPTCYALPSKKKNCTFVYSAMASSVFPCDTKSFPLFFRLFNSFAWRARLPKEKLPSGSRE